VRDSRPVGRNPKYGETGASPGRVISTGLSPCRMHHPRQWDGLLPVLSLAYNICQHRATGMAPFDLPIPRYMPTLTVEGLTGSSALASADGSPLTVMRASIQPPPPPPPPRLFLEKYQDRCN